MSIPGLHPSPAALFGGLVPPNPAMLSVAPLLWVSGRAGSATMYKTSLAAAGNGESVHYWVRPGDTVASPVYNYGVQSTSGDQPTAVVTSSRFYIDGGSSDYMNLNSALALTGTFTAWIIGKRSASGAIWVPLGHSTNSDGIILYSDDNMYLDNGSTFVSNAFSGTNGSVIVLKVYRNGSDNCYMQSTGMALTFLGNMTGTIDLNRIQARPGSSTFTGSGTLTGDIVVTTAVGNANDDAIMAAYHLREWGVSL